MARRSCHVCRIFDVALPYRKIQWFVSRRWTRTWKSRAISCLGNVEDQKQRFCLLQFGHATSKVIFTLMGASLAPSVNGTRLAGPSLSSGPQL